MVLRFKVGIWYTVKIHKNSNNQNLPNQMQFIFILHYASVKGR